MDEILAIAGRFALAVCLLGVALGMAGAIALATADGAVPPLLRRRRREDAAEALEPPGAAGCRSHAAAPPLDRGELCLRLHVTPEGDLVAAILYRSVPDESHAR